MINWQSIFDCKVAGYNVIITFATHLLLIICLNKIFTELAKQMAAILKKIWQSPGWQRILEERDKQ